MGYDVCYLQPGQEIKYEIQRSRNRVKNKSGIVLQIANRHVTVQLGKYRDSFYLIDVNPPEPRVGGITITSIKEGGIEVGKIVDWKVMWPKVQELLAGGMSETDISTTLNIEKQLLTAKLSYEAKKQAKTDNKPPSGEVKALQDQEVKQTPTPNSEQVGSQGPNQERAESDKTSITVEESVQEVNLSDLLMAELEYKQIFNELTIKWISDVAISKLPTMAKLVLIKTVSEMQYPGVD